jgi:hypothetical protein
MRTLTARNAAGTDARLTRNSHVAFFFFSIQTLLTGVRFGEELPFHDTPSPPFTK